MAHDHGVSHGRLRERESPFPMIPVEDAIGTVLAQAQPLAPQRTKLADIRMGSILASDITAPDPLPPFRASVMDGYAVVAADGAGVLEIVGRITAGVDPDSVRVGPGKCAYITTGAKVPEGADAVVKVEDTVATAGGDPSAFDAGETSVRILKAVEAGRSIRPVGHDVKKGETVLSRAEKLYAAEVGLLATVGVVEADVSPPPIVGVMSTGDELVEPGEPLSGGFIRDSNRSTLLAAIKEMGASAVDLGIVRDKTSSLEGAVKAALDKCDVLVTSGGVSMGESDLLKPILESLGKVHFGRIRMKPGKPTTFATADVDGRKRLVFALPGNPVSSLVCAHLFVLPAIRRLKGYAPEDCMHAQVDARLATPLRLDPERPEYHRALVAWDGISGTFVASSTGSQMSSRLLSMKSANALLCLPTTKRGGGSSTLEKGATVSALLIGPLPAPPASMCFHATAVRIAATGGPSAAGGEPGAGHEGLATAGPSGYVSFPPVAAAGGEAGAGGQAHAGGSQGNESPPPPPGDAHSHSHSHSHSHAHDHSHEARAAHGHGHGHGHDHSHNHDHAGRCVPKVRACLLTVSDRASQGVYQDLSGPAMRECITKEGLAFEATVVESQVVADEPGAIQAAVKRWCDDLHVDLVLTSGGTGFGRRDTTPEAIRPLLHREAPGLVHAIYQGGLKFTPLAVMSRPVAGTRHNTLVVTLPGSVKAVRENVGTLAPLVPHIVNLLQGNQC